jgi:hypothetical protein
MEKEPSPAAVSLGFEPMVAALVTVPVDAEFNEPFHIFEEQVVEEEGTPRYDDRIGGRVRALEAEIGTSIAPGGCGRCRLFVTGACKFA